MLMFLKCVQAIDPDPAELDKGKRTSAVQKNWASSTQRFQQYEPSYLQTGKK